MTDVRLTATNPEDSTLVPVACNSRGELLIEEPVIEQIDNNVEINGGLTLNVPKGNGETIKWQFKNNDGRLNAQNMTSGFVPFSFLSGGQVTVQRKVDEVNNKIILASGANSWTQTTANNTEALRITWDGFIYGPNVRIMLEPEVNENYTLYKSSESQEEVRKYVGPVLDVKTELQFLRQQLRETMEKLKMVPEGGWEVWDGSSDS